MSKWVTEGLENAKTGTVDLPNKGAPRLVPDKNFNKQPKQQAKFYVQNKTTLDQLRTLIKLLQVIKNEDINFSSFVEESIDLNLKKRKLYSLKELSNGATFTPDDLG